MDKKIAMNYIYNLAYQLLAIILPFVTAPYISRVLKPDGIGIFNYTYSVVSIFVLIASLGSHAYAQKEIAFAGQNRKIRSITFGSILTIRIISSVFVSILYLFLIIFRIEYRTMYTIEYLCILANMIDISWLFQGIEDFKKTAMRSIIIKILSVLAIFLLVNEENDLLIYTFICTFSTLLNAIILWWYVPGVVDRTKICWNDVRNHIIPIFMLFLPMAAIHVYTHIDKVILGLLSTESEVGFYSQAEKIVKLLMTIITSMGTVLLPRVALDLKSGKKDVVQVQIKDAIHFVCALGIPMVVGLIVISPMFIPWFLGNRYGPSIRLMQVLAVLILIIGLSSVTGQAVLIPLNKQKIYTISIFGGMIINIIVNVILIPVLNSMGAVIGTLSAELLVGTIQQFVVLKELKLKIVDEVRDNLVSLCCGAVMGVVLYSIKSYFTSSFLSLLLFSIIGIFIYGMGMWLLQDRFLTQVKLMIRRKRGN